MMSFLSYTLLEGGSRTEEVITLNSIIYSGKYKCCFFRFLGNMIELRGEINNADLAGYC